MRTFILADNQDITREGLQALLRRADENADIIVARSYDELLQSLRQSPDAVVILDYTLFDFSSADRFLNAKAGAWESSWLLFSDELNDGFLRKALLADSTINVIMKHDTSENIRTAIEKTVAYERYLCDTAQTVLKNNFAMSQEVDTLTATEKIILKEIALGKMTKEIAWEKGLSFHTVNTHRRNIFRKLGVNNVHEATKYAFKVGLVEWLEYYI